MSDHEHMRDALAYAFHGQRPTETNRLLDELKRYKLARGTFSRPVYVDPVLNHTELAEKIATARYWERVTGVRTPLHIEQIIQSWELDR